MSSRILLTYDLLVLACTAGFAAYDLHTRRVSDRALLHFCPIALMAPFLHALAACMPADASARWNGQPALYMTPAAAQTETCMPGLLAALPPAILSSLAGAATGFLILLAAALISKNGAGIGGGDIKLAAVMGFAYGPYRMAAILLTASGLTAIVSIAIKLRRKGKAGSEVLSLPFVPFLAIGSLAATIATAL